MVLEYLAAALLLLGSLLLLTAGIGLKRLPNALCRSHALSKAVTLGLSLILLAFMITAASVAVAIKIGLVLIFHLITIPLSGHTFALYSVRHLDD